VSVGTLYITGALSNISATGNSNPLPGVTDNAGTLSTTWDRHPDFAGFPDNYGSAFVVETSATLAAPPPAPGGGAGLVVITGNNVKPSSPPAPKTSSASK
jgi:hypothetical protein